jgi:hypothetical protein
LLSKLLQSLKLALHFRSKDIFFEQ